MDNEFKKVYEELPESLQKRMTQIGAGPKGAIVIILDGPIVHIPTVFGEVVPSGAVGPSLSFDVEYAYTTESTDSKPYTITCTGEPVD
jgi:hypothetical protein